MGTPRRKRYAERRKRRMDAAQNDLTADQWQTLLALWGACAYCGKTEADLQKDCVLALSRGGSYTASNVVPACRSCNASKGNQEVTVWMGRKRMPARDFFAKWVQVNQELDQLPKPESAP